MNKNEKIDLAIERGFRIFQTKIENFHFYMIQLQIEKSKLTDGCFEFQLLNNLEKLVYKQKIELDLINNKIIIPQSHEDPLISNDFFYMICFEIPLNLIKNLTNEKYTIIFKKNEKLLINKIIPYNLKKMFTTPEKKYSFISSQYYIFSKEDCIFRFHLGDENGNYSEIEQSLKAYEKIYFKNFLKYPYLGLQCSYENKKPELEEKHIIIGQKGMTLSGDFFFSQTQKYCGLLPFKNIYKILYINNKNNFDIKFLNLMKSKYFKIKKENWKQIDNIKELLLFHQYKKIFFYEIDSKFIENQYKTQETYGLNKTFSLQKSKKHHIDLELCKNCLNRSLCMELVPSGLSNDLFKINLFLEKPQECEIFKFINLKKYKNS